jgi:hypothetical protein
MVDRERVLAKLDEMRGGHEILRTKHRGAATSRLQPLVFLTPRAGLEPATNRLTADRSTD